MTRTYWSRDVLDREYMARILVIDDEPDVVSYLSTFLIDEGHEVVTARNGKRGLELAATEKPDLITLDITMPGMSGIEVFTALRRNEELTEIPVIIITGVAKFEKLTEYREVREPEGFMQKPIDLQHLVSLIDKTFGKTEQ